MISLAFVQATYRSRDYREIVVPVATNYPDDECDHASLEELHGNHVILQGQLFKKTKKKTLT